MWEYFGYLESTPSMPSCSVPSLGGSGSMFSCAQARYEFRWRMRGWSEGVWRYGSGGQAEWAMAVSAMVAQAFYCCAPNGAHGAHRLGFYLFLLLFGPRRCNCLSNAIFVIPWGHSSPIYSVRSTLSCYWSSPHNMAKSLWHSCTVCIYRVEVDGNK